MPSSATLSATSHEGNGKMRPVSEVKAVKQSGSGISTPRSPEKTPEGPGSPFMDKTNSISRSLTSAETKSNSHSSSPKMTIAHDLLPRFLDLLQSLTKSLPLLLLSVMLGLVVFNAWAHVIMGHEWTIFVYQGFLFEWITAWPWMSAGEYRERLQTILTEGQLRVPGMEAVVPGSPPNSDLNSVTNSVSWLPATLYPDEYQLVPFTPVLYDIFVVFPQLRVNVITHCICGSIALTVGFVQLYMTLGTLKKYELEALSPLASPLSTNRKLHRALGWVYAVTFTITGVTGAILGANDVKGQLARWNFFAMGVFAIVPTWVAVYKVATARVPGGANGNNYTHIGSADSANTANTANTNIPPLARSQSAASAVFLRSEAEFLRKQALYQQRVYLNDLQHHRDWMLRSYAVCFSVAVFLRFSFLWLVPLMAERIPEDIGDPYMICVFLSWSLPIPCVDLWLTMRGRGGNDKYDKFSGDGSEEVTVGSEGSQWGADVNEGGEKERVSERLGAEESAGGVRRKEGGRVRGARRIDTKKEK